MASGATLEQRRKKIRSILDTATQVFAEYGYAGARTDDIADKAGISKRSMYYHLGDKETLYGAVIKDLVEKIKSNMFIDTIKDQAPEQKLKQYIRCLAHTVDTYPEIHIIAIRENLVGGENMPGDLPKTLDDQLVTFMDIYAEGVRKGEFAETNPLALFFMIYGLLFCWKINMPLLSRSLTTRKMVKELGGDVSGKLIEEVERTVFEILKPETDEVSRTYRHRC